MLKKTRFNQGFTLVELIMTVVILGIIAVYAAPRLLDRPDISASVYADRAISILRNMQMRAMQDTRTDGYCFQVNFDTTNHELGTPRLEYFDDGVGTHVPADTCSTVIDTSDPEELFYIPASDLTKDGISLTAINSRSADITYIKFNSQGLPEPSTGSCDSTCTIVFTGETNASICIESEGYVHAC